MSSLEILEDACVRLPHTKRAMFGGHGFFAPNGGMFAGIVTDDAIILKLADEKVRTELVALGGAPWVYKSKTADMTMKEWIVIPDAFYDDPVLLASWTKRAHALAPAKKAKAKKAAAPPKRPAKRAKGR